MKKYTYEGKTKEEAISKALEELKVAEKNLIVNVLEEKNTLLKKSVKIEVINYNDLVDYIKEHKWDKDQGGPIDLNNVYHICNGTDVEQFDANSKKYVLPDPDLDDPDLFCAVYTGAIKRANNVGLLLKQ